jgi:hypothetical protein
MAMLILNAPHVSHESAGGVTSSAGENSVVRIEWESCNIVFPFSNGLIGIHCPSFEPTFFVSLDTLYAVDDCTTECTFSVRLSASQPLSL